MVTSSYGWNSPKRMVAEWEAAVTEFNELTPLLQYGLSSWRWASHRVNLCDKPQKIVVISTIETYYQWFNYVEANSSKFWGPGILHWVILDEAHRLRMSGTPIGKFRKANGMLVKMDSSDYKMHMASCILCMEPQYKWMLTATLLLNGMKDLSWNMRFLESSSWLTLQLPPDTVDFTLNIDDNWVADGCNMSDTEDGAWFTPVADPYKKSPEFRSLVYCTTMPRDAYMLPIVDEVGTLGKATKTMDIVIRWHRYEWTIGIRAFADSEH